MRRMAGWLMFAVLVTPLLGPGCGEDEQGSGYRPCIRPPTTPCRPDPPDSATGVSTDADLSWSCSRSECGLPVTHDVYLGTYSPPPYVGSTTRSTLDPGRLEPNTLYRWRVVARDAIGSAEGPAFCFITAEEHACLLPPTDPRQPSPADCAGGVSVGAILRWQGGDSQCDLPVSYDVHFGSISPPPLVATVTQKAFYPSLGYAACYYWKVVARDDNGSAGGATWQFMTAQRGVEVLSAYLNLRINDDNDNGASLCVHECTGGWNEGSLTWNNAPGWVSQILGRGSRYTDSDGSLWMQFSIPRYLVEHWIASPVFNFGLTIDDGLRNYPGLDTCTEFYTKEAKGGCFSPDPYLKVTWRAPGGGSQVSTFLPMDDAWAHQAFPDAQRGTRTTMWAGWGRWGSLSTIGNARIYLKFDVRVK